MDFQVQNIIHNITQTFGGNPWHGNSLKVLLADVDANMAFCRPFEHKRNIAELLAHILTWRQFALEILRENYEFTIDVDSVADFPEVTASEKVWQELLTQLDENQALIVEKLTAFSDDDLDKKIPEQYYTFRYLFEGIVYHDVYHGGQIGFIKSSFIKSPFLDDDLMKTLSFF